MDAPQPSEHGGRIPRSSPLPPSSASASAPLSSPQPHHVQSSMSMAAQTAPSAPNQSATASSMLNALIREREILSSMKASVPNAWSILEAEILRVKGLLPDSQSLQQHLLHSSHAHPHQPSHTHSHLYPHILHSTHPSSQNSIHSHANQPLAKQHPQLQSQHQLQHQLQLPHQNQLPSQQPPLQQQQQQQQLVQGPRKRIKLRVPAEKYPDYNFVGRLLGPRGATLKKLEHDAGCKIMIRGRGSIRKDKEAEVRGKPGWEHVFNETLHVVIEVSDAVDDADASRILNRAKEMVELLLVPVPEERDTLKRQQLRDLAILNGTFRANDGANNGNPVGVGSIGQGPSVGMTGSVGHIGSSNAYPSHPNLPSHIMANAATGRDYAIPGPIITHSANSNMESHSLAQTESLLSRRRTAPLPSTAGLTIPNNINFSSTASQASVSSNPVLPRHNSSESDSGLNSFPVRNQLNNSHGKQTAKPNLSSRSEGFLPDIGSLRIPSLDLENMNELFLVSPMMGAHGMPGPSPTIVDPDMYPFPPTPGVLSDHPSTATAFGSPIWSQSAIPQSSSNVIPASSPSKVVGSPPASSPPRQSPSAVSEGATTTSINGSLSSIVLGSTLREGMQGSPAQQFQGSRAKSKGEPAIGLGLTYSQKQRTGGVHDHLQRGNLFESSAHEQTGAETGYGNAAFTNYFPKVTGVQSSTPNGLNSDSSAKDFAHTK